jgi:hypothetical protein
MLCKQNVGRKPLFMVLLPDIVLGEDRKGSVEVQERKIFTRCFMLRFPPPLNPLLSEEGKPQLKNGKNKTPPL